MKKRFGVSLPVELAEDLDRLAEELDSDRSSIIAEALRTYIHDHLYYIHRHKCLGILVSIRNKDSRLKPSINYIEKYSDIIKNYNHIHIDNLCIEILIVHGGSDRIARLHSILKKYTPCVRYIPLASLREEGRG